jgi:hypothetical protein
MVGVVAWSFTFSWGWYQNQQRTKDVRNTAHQASVENCLAINELKRDIYITLADFKVPPQQRVQFKPTRNCERLP